MKLALTLAQEAGHSDVERILLRAGAAPDAKRPADADALEEALLLPEGFVPGQADSEEVEGQIQAGKCRKMVFFVIFLVSSFFSL